jgi:hypothetical protein
MLLEIYLRRRFVTYRKEHWNNLLLIFIPYFSNFYATWPKLKPILGYEIELCGCASKSHIVIMQRTQSKILRAIGNEPWYVRNHTHHSDLKVPYVRDVIHERIGKHHTNLEDHPNPLLEPLLQPTYNRKLNSCWLFDLKDTLRDIAECTPHHATVSQPHIA